MRPTELLRTDLLMELVAAGMSAGLPTASALTAVVESAGALRPPGPVDRGARARAPVPLTDEVAALEVVAKRLALGVPAEQVWQGTPKSLAPLGRALALAELAGAATADVVRRAAADDRARRRAVVEAAAARLGVRLVLPLGLAVLPGFVLLAVLPVVLGLADSILSPG